MRSCSTYGDSGHRVTFRELWLRMVLQIIVENNDVVVLSHLLRDAGQITGLHMDEMALEECNKVLLKL